MITWREGNGSSDNNRIARLCSTWWYESLFFKTYGVTYEPDMDLFARLNEMGMLVTILGENDDDKLVACYAGAISNYQFNASVRICNEIVWCVHPDHRNSRTGLQLIRQIDKVMREKGVDLYPLAVSQEDKFKPLDKYLARKENSTLMDKVYFMEVIENG